MTNEEMQRKMDFIVEHQAQFAANIQRLEEQRLRDQPRIQELEESFRLLVRLAQIANSTQDSTDVRLDRTEFRLDKLETGQQEILEHMSTLATAQIHTEERLSTLIDIVRERWK